MDNLIKLVIEAEPQGWKARSRAAVLLLVRDKGQFFLEHA